jgi:Zn-dependent peptidase ImmA (M78 family)
METLRIGGRRYSDPDIISLCRQSGELIDPRSTIVNMARALTEKVNGFSGLPSDPLERLKIIASLSRMKILPMNMDQVRSEKRDAALYPTANGGWTVLYNPNRPKARIIFTIGHEIVHTFFPSSTNGARFRTITNPGSREANELELLCHLGASELVMPLSEFQRHANGRFGLSEVERLASFFGTSFEATVYRLATAHPGLAVAGMLQFRLTKDEERRQTKTTNQRALFSNLGTLESQRTERKYRRQSVHLSGACREEEYTIRFNKSFDSSSVVYTAREGEIQSDVESLPNLANVRGRIEAILCPYQGHGADADFGDVFFFWEQINDRI